MAPTPSSKPLQSQGTPCRTPQAKQRLHLATTPRATVSSPISNSAANKETAPPEHPVEVIGRIRDFAADSSKPVSAVQISSHGRSIRVRTDIGYRDFSLDGVSVSEEEDLDGFYRRFVESRINGVKLGSKCTIMMYGPTGSGKSHTMFGCPKQPGIVYRALRDILGDVANNENDVASQRFGSFVQAAVLEIYNEEIYDLLSSDGGGGAGIGWQRGNASRVRLEVMRGKAKNANFISGNEAGKISREIAKVEKRRIVKSTLCNERSSRSHCMIILDVPSVGGRLTLVDMAGSENIDQAGQTGFEAKMQTAKINQGNIALKRVVESIANGDSHVPFRDSKLTMLLQDAFEDDKSKILMILCANPDPKDMHKTISTLEYGAKAKCIVRASINLAQDKTGTEDSSAIVLGSRIAAMDQFIRKLQTENKLKEKERDDAQKELQRKEKEIAELRTKLKATKGRESAIVEEEINMKVNERTKILKIELERKLQECQKITNEFMEVGRRRMEEKIFQQQEEVEMLRRRLEEIESELCKARKSNDCENGSGEIAGSNFIRRLSEIYVNGDQGMEKSMDLDIGDHAAVLHVQDARVINDKFCRSENSNTDLGSNPCLWDLDGDDVVGLQLPERVCLSTVFEADEEGNDGNDDDEVEKEILEEYATPNANAPSSVMEWTPHSFVREAAEHNDHIRSGGERENGKDAATARRTRIQNIFMLCGNHRELAQHVRNPNGSKRNSATATDSTRLSPISVGEELITKQKTKERSEFQLSSSSEADFKSHDQMFVTEGILETCSVEKSISTLKASDNNAKTPSDAHSTKSHSLSETTQEAKENRLVEVYVKWEATKEHGGKFITKLKLAGNSTLAHLRKLIENNMGDQNEKEAFAFLMLGDPTGAPVAKEKETTFQVSKLPSCNNQLHSIAHLASLRSMKKTVQRPADHLPFSSLENKLPFSPAALQTGMLLHL